MRQKIIHLKKKFNKNNPGFRSCNIDDESKSTLYASIKIKNEEKHSDSETQRASYKFNDDFSLNCKDKTICSSLNSDNKEDWNNKSNGNPEEIININIQKSDSKKMDINNDDKGELQKQIDINGGLSTKCSTENKNKEKEKRKEKLDKIKELENSIIFTILREVIIKFIRRSLGFRI